MNKTITNPHSAVIKMPAPILFLAVIGVAIIIVPLVSIWYRINITDIPRLLWLPDTQQLLAISLSSAIWSTIISVSVGVPLALAISGFKRGGTVIRLLVFLPLALPPVVAGLALSAAIGRRGIFAPVLEIFNIEFAFTFSGVVASHVFISLPFVVVAVDSAFRQLNKEVIYSATSIGMSYFEIIRKIIFPTLIPAISTGAGLAYARSLGEFGTTLTFAGSLPGTTRTMPIGIYLEREINPEAAYALAAILILCALGALLISVCCTFLFTTRKKSPDLVAIDPIDIPRLRELSRPSTSLSSPLLLKTNRTTVSFQPQETTAIIGPNGSGKTTLLGLISGKLQGAELSEGTTVLSDMSPQKRSIVMLTQSPSLPPQSTVLGAVTMATRDRHHAMELLTAAGLRRLGSVRCCNLSGGQAAQVGLVRALAARPRVLLLDEPLAAIDIAQAHMWRSFLQAAAHDRTCLVVSHDPFDVSAIASTIVVVDQGIAIAAGPTDKVLAEPAHEFVAEFAGVNVISGQVLAVDNTIATLAIGTITLQGVTSAKINVHAEAKALFSPDAVTLTTRNQPDAVSSAQNHFASTILGMTSHGAVTVVTLAVENAAKIRVPLTTISARSLDLAVNQTVFCSIKTMAIKIVES
ncbi:molybdate transport system permease protein [Corynebacterium diphtheriae BH8]|uniref:ATP-binding cassette domain-containing protein n=1 Tax=Corynebacterium diphtheriae TaxID=1717 RepID=UPI000245AFE8|nr:ATP-binding cassette domain-containing protein [Corynebacterium diphtheriae]AEX47958.1 molybdate transport system permease protein [Corynebacterium diphtheriae BH8]MBG9356217.1 ATP-binding cassette domain-containing protein [Corynebacterium diphtheriae bv. mitis]TBX18952.1 molybdenum ABC transporter ATP-binding protein [Corynebacterium diphtheriae]